MIRIEKIIVCGQSDAGAFEGSFTFKEGLQVISADNHFGKSLAVTSIAWCLGLEPIFGLQDNDTSRFPMAVREVIDLNGNVNVPVRSSRSILILRRTDGARLRITREILGNPAEVVVEELGPDLTVARVSRLEARKWTMSDEAAGLQNFLYKWCGLPRTPVMTNRGVDSELYLENIAPLFYIDQNEGWTDLQALQVHRYGLLEISSVAVEYLLGATTAIEQRFKRQTISANEARLKAGAAALSSQVSALFERHGWITNTWSDHGGIPAIVKRWSAQTLIDSLKKEFDVDLGEQQAALRGRVETLRAFLTQGQLDPNSASAPSDASQSVVELKDQRHKRREELRVLRRQHSDQLDLIASIEHRLHSARDVLRLKKEGIGRIEIVECPTCHRSIDPSTFQLTAQSTESVEAHIAALERDRILVRDNMTSSEAQIIRLSADLSGVEGRLREAERALGTVNQAIGASREQLAKTASDLATAETEIERVAETARELLGLQTQINDWITKAGAAETIAGDSADLDQRLKEFTLRLLELLTALGHSAILSQPEPNLRLDDHYIPHLGPRRLRSLGSASDHSRLVAAYVLALAVASEAKAGLHPGFVVLDEPLQQNPDDPHRERFTDFLTGETAQALKVQTIVFTYLRGTELERLREKGVNVITPDIDHFLQLVRPQETEELEGTEAFEGERARAAITSALEGAVWDEAAGIVRFRDFDGNQLTAHSREELENMLGELASDEWHNQALRIDGEYLGSCDEDTWVSEALEDYEEQLGKVFHEREDDEET